MRKIVRCCVLTTRRKVLVLSEVDDGDLRTRGLELGTLEAFDFRQLDFSGALVNISVAQWYQVSSGDPLRLLPSLGLFGVLNQGVNDILG